VSTKFHELRRWNEFVYGHCAPLDFRKNIVHLLNARDSVERDAGVEKTLEINFVRVLAQEKNVLAHDEAPHRMIDRCVIVVTLIDCELAQMFWTSRDRGIVIDDTDFRIERASGRYRIKIDLEHIR